MIDDGLIALFKVYKLEQMKQGTFYRNLRKTRPKPLVPFRYYACF
jgi:hypothetical protein